MRFSTNEEEMDQGIVSSMEKENIITHRIMPEEPREKPNPTRMECFEKKKDERRRDSVRLLRARAIHPGRKAKAHGEKKRNGKTYSPLMEKMKKATPKQKPKERPKKE
jgi:hypothetical protein